MKQKNLIMLGVAIGCGLVAAIAVAKLSAGGSKGPETIKLLVAIKDIPLDTTIDDKNLSQFLAYSEVPKSLAPLDPVTDLAAIAKKNTNRTLKAGNVLALGDFGSAVKTQLPDGMKQIALKIADTDAVDGFAKPGAKVDVMYIERMSSGKTRAAILLRDMLMLAVGKIDRLDEKTGTSIPVVQSVSIGVNDKQATLLALSEKKGTLKLVLRNGPLTKAEQGLSGEIEWIDDPFDASGPTATVSVSPPAEKFDTVVVAKRAVPQNTILNKDNVKDFFDVDEVKKAPEGVFTSTDELLGRFVIKDVAEGTRMYRTLVGDKAVVIEKKDEPKDPVVGPKIEPKPPTPMVVVERPKYPRFVQTIAQGGQVRKIIWLEIAPGTWKDFDSEKSANDYRGESEKTEKKPDGDTTTGQ